MNGQTQIAVSQNPFLRAAMARSSLAAASQMAWQHTDEMHEQRALFVKVTGLPADHTKWRRAVTWNSAVLVSLSVEQSLKALATMASPTSVIPRTHDLIKLWKLVGARTQARIDVELQWVRDTTAGTRLAQGDLAADQIVRHHRKTFELARYYNVKDPTNPPNELTNNIDLWQLALAGYRAASLALTSALAGMAPPGDDIRWPDVVAFNERIGRRMPGRHESS